MSNRFGIIVAVLCAVFLGSTVAQIGMWQDLPLQCYSCPKGKCDGPPTNATTCGERLDLCHTIFKDGKVISRGCSSAVAKDVGGYCKNNPKECFSCKSNRCNIATDKKDYIECLYCNSYSNPLCVTNPEAIKSTIKCHKSCMVALYPGTDELDPNYELIRTCLDDKEEADRQLCELNGQKCKSCTGEKCNTHKLPEDRLKCYNCRGVSCEIAKPSVCLSYNKRDQCIFLLDTTKKFASAQCKSSLPPASIPDLMLKNQLVICNGDSCNKLNKMPKPQNCLKCNSIENLFCATDPKQINTVTHCDNAPNTHCFTQIRDGITFRGCATDLDTLERIQCSLQKSDYCQTCLGEKCNDEVFPKDRRRCYSCNSSNDKACEASPKNATVCSKYLQGDSCVVHYNDKKITQRGCLSDLPCDGKDNKKCRICADHNCNVVNLKKENSAAGIYLTIGSLLAMITHLVL